LLSDRCWSTTVAAVADRGRRASGHGLGLGLGLGHGIGLAGYNLAMATDDDLEIAYYRTVEDLFATLRGVPHVLSPKDFHLLRQWWRDEIPIAAVRAGITEVFAKRRERGEPDPVVSLSYCRHAVKTHARRIAEMHVGASDEGVRQPEFDAEDALRSLESELNAAAESQRDPRPRVADAIEGIATTVGAAHELPPAGLEEHLFALESALLTTCLASLSHDECDELEGRARADAAASTTNPEARDRAFRAFRDRLLRDLLALPRLELDG